MLRPVGFFTICTCVSSFSNINSGVRVKRAKKFSAHCKRILKLGYLQYNPPAVMHKYAYGSARCVGKNENKSIINECLDTLGTRSVEKKSNLMARGFRPNTEVNCFEGNLQLQTIKSACSS